MKIQTINAPIVIQGQELIFNGLLQAGGSHDVTIQSCTGVDIDIGGLTGQMTSTADIWYSREELQQMIADDIKFETDGLITVYDVSASDFAGISGSITLSAIGSAARVQFVSSSEWPNLSVEVVRSSAGSAIIIDSDITIQTTVGELSLDGGMKGIDVASGVTLQSNTDLFVQTVDTATACPLGLSSLTDSTIRVVTDSQPQWLSNSNIVIGCPIVASSVDMSSSDTLTLSADVDGNGVGTLTLQATSGIDVQTGGIGMIVLQGADITLQSTTTIQQQTTSQTDVTLQVSPVKTSATATDIESVILLGTITEATGGITLPTLSSVDSVQSCKLSNAELLSIDITGILTIGGSATSAIYVGGLLSSDIASDVRSLSLLASASATSFITTLDTPNVFSLPIAMISRHDITLQSSVTLSNGVDTKAQAQSISGLTIIADSDCTGQGTIIVDTSTVSISTVDASISLKSSDIVMNGPIIAGSGIIGGESISYSTCSSQAISIGSTQLSTYDDSTVSTPVSTIVIDELSKFTCSSLTFSVSGGTIVVNEVTQGSTSGISSIVNLAAESFGSEIQFRQSSQWPSLIVQSGSGIRFMKMSNIETTEGILLLDGDVSGIVIDAGVALSSATDLSFQTSSGICSSLVLV